MKKTLFALIPAGVVLLYTVAQLILYLINHRMYFSSVFAWELIIYAVLGLFYISAIFYLGHSAYLKYAILGLILGAIIFVVIGVTLFLNFEFSRDLAI